MSSFSHFCSKNNKKVFENTLAITVNKTVNEFVINKVIELTIFWTTGPWCLNILGKYCTTSDYCWSLLSTECLKQSVYSLSRIVADGIVFIIFYCCFSEKIKLGSESSWPRWLNVCHTGDQEVAGSILTRSRNILLWRLIMEYFLWSFSSFCWFKKNNSVSVKRRCRSTG